MTSGGRHVRQDHKKIEHIAEQDGEQVLEQAGAHSQKCNRPRRQKRKPNTEEQRTQRNRFLQGRSRRLVCRERQRYSAMLGLTRKQLRSLASFLMLLLVAMRNRRHRDLPARRAGYESPARQCREANPTNKSEFSPEGTAYSVSQATRRDRMRPAGTLPPGGLLTSAQCSHSMTAWRKSG